MKKTIKIILNILFILAAISMAIYIYFIWALYPIGKRYYYLLIISFALLAARNILFRIFKKST